MQDIIFKDESTIDLFETFDTLLDVDEYKIYTNSIKNFMTNHLDQTYRRAKNSVYWFQLFLNGAWLEREIVNKNRNVLNYQEDDHGFLGGNKQRGNFIPDFQYSYNSSSYSIDTKTYYNLQSFNADGYNNFEGAKFVIAFIISECKYYVRTRVNDSRAYTYAECMSELQGPIKDILSGINLPEEVKMIYFNINKDTEDTETQQCIEYTVRSYKIK